MAKYLSPRYSIPFNRIPAQFVPIGSYVWHSSKNAVSNYGPILDCVYEMADMIAESNGVSYNDAISQVLKDEKWSILKTDRETILAKLKV